jgi:DNA-binding response OmpR family regulator
MAELSTILIADDDPGSLILLEGLLTAPRRRILTASNGLQAQEIIEQEAERLAVVILDWSMPGLSGMELLRWIKDHPQVSEVPVILQTARDEPESIREGIEAGAFYYLTKPVAEEVLLSVTGAAITDHKERLELLAKLHEARNPFATLAEGRFHVRTLDEAQSLAVMLANSCAVPANAMSIAELLVNAIEHGNLELTYDDKTELLEGGTWLDEVRRRLKLDRYRDRLVRVHVTRMDTIMTVYIEDEGEGFDYTRYLTMDESRVFHTHGRGIAMAGSVLKIQYLGAGNRVLVSLPLTEEQKDE